MAEKEERILIARSSDYTLTDTDKGELFEGKIAPHCANVFTRKEAIERMAKEIFTLRFTPLEIKGKGWDDLNGWQKGNCLRIAEAALKALLGE